MRRLHRLEFGSSIGWRRAGCGLDAILVFFVGGMKHPHYLIVVGHEIFAQVLKRIPENG